MNWNFVETKSGHKTVVLKKANRKIFLHSKYDPVKEAQRWVAQWEIKKHAPKKILVIGLGAGFHLEQLIKEFPKIPVIVWEFNPEYWEWLNNHNLQNFLNSKNNQMFVSDSWLEIRNKFLPLLDDSDTMVLFHSPSFELIPEKLASLKELLDHHILFIRTVRRHSNQLDFNFELNVKLQDLGINNWRDTLKNKSSILISAGPSLTKQLPYLADIRKMDTFFLACVGTALKPLLDYGIEPDLVMVSDPQINIKDQFIYNNTSIPLFYLSTANHEAISNYLGPRFIVWQKGFTKSEKQSKLRGEPLLQTGGSVATCLLELLVFMGTRHVGLVGQDLAFTNGNSHAEGTHGNHIVNLDNLREIPDFYQQGRVRTSKNLYVYLKWFENYSRSLNKDIALWNCTEGGAYIPGWINSDLYQFVKKAY